jgi:hypothetical protein
VSATIGAQSPGPSAALFATPYYKCTTNYYVAVNGSDSNPGTSAAPWASIHQANGSGGPGVCVNIAPGSYAAGAVITKGGNVASSSGYMVYRCQTLDGCTITDPGNNNSAAFDVQANYVMIDGFNLAASSATLYGQGVEVWNGNNSFAVAQHHVWVLNSIVSGYGQSGLQLNNGEYLYAVHNKIYGNASAGCAAQGSGISLASEIALSGYTPTADDTNNAILGAIGSGFHNAVMWNVVYNNALTTCGSAADAYDTDGNDVILDSWGWNHGSGPLVANAVPYTGGGLVAFNVVYNAGGGGVHVFYTGNVTVANNTCYNTYLDPYNTASARGCMDSTTWAVANTFINNIAVAIPAAPSGSNGACQYTTVPYAQFNVAILGGPPAGQPADSYSHNITQMRVNPSCFGTDFIGYAADAGLYSCASNKCATDPQWVNVGISSVGTETKPPVGANFALLASAPGIGYGLAEPYLSPQSIDAGACFHTLSTCP